HLAEIEKHFPGTVTMTILYQGPPGSARTLGLVRHLAALQDELARDPLVLRTASLADLVKALHKTFNADDPHPYRLPDSQELLAQLMYLGESPAFERFTDRALAKAVLVAYLRDDDSARVGPLVRRAQAWVDAHPPPEGVRVLIAGGVGPTILAVTGAGFSVMGFSKFLGLQLFGTLMPIAMAVSCLAALSLMPVLVLRTRPAFVFGRAAKEGAGRGRAPRAAAGRRG